MISVVTYVGRQLEIVLAPETERERTILLLLESKRPKPFRFSDDGLELRSMVDLVDA